MNDNRRNMKWNRPHHATECVFVRWTALAWLVALCCASGEIVLQPKNATATGEVPAGIVVPDPSSSSEDLEQVFDMIEFLNGDKLRGTFFSIEESRGVRWRHPHVEEVMHIDPRGIDSIQLNRPSSTNSHPNHTCLVRCLNDDQLVGELVNMDTNGITLNTWYAGLLTIPRRMTRSIVPGQAKSGAIYEGPNSIEGWTVKSSGGFRVGGRTVPSGWQYRSGAFIGSGSSSVGKDIQLPPQSNIEFDLAWQGYLQMGVSFYTDKLERYGSDSYMLQLGSGSVYLQRVSQEGNSSNLGHSEASALQQKGSARISIRSSKEQKTVSFLIDGELVKQWTDRGEFASGTGLVFYQQGQGRVKISRIRVTEWDGKLDDPDAGTAASQQDLVKLGNNDKISGNLKAIRDGKVHFGTEFATLEIPLERVAEIEMASDSADPMPSAPGDVRAVFAGQGAMTLQLRSWDDQQVAAVSPAVGPVKFIPSAFTRINFNLDQERSEDDLFGGFDDF